MNSLSKLAAPLILAGATLAASESIGCSSDVPDHNCLPPEYTGIGISNKGKNINTLVLFDDKAYPGISDAKIENNFELGSKLLQERTTIRFKILKIIHTQISSDEERKKTIDDAIRQNPETIRNTNYIVYFTKYPEVVPRQGGQSYWITPLNYPGLEGYCNTTDGDFYHNIPVAGVDWNFRYQPCGYDSKTGEHISETSIGDECQNAPGSFCTYRPDLGYYMCNQFVDTLYDSDERMRRMTIVIHELMHHYGKQGNGDHNFDSEVCKLSYRNTLTYQCPQFLPPEQEDGAKGNLRACWFNICPYVWGNFTNSVNLCSCSN